MEGFDSILNNEPYTGNLKIDNMPTNLEKGSYKLKFVVTGFNKKEAKYNVNEMIKDITY